MGTTIITKNGSGAPAASDLVAGELAVDLTNKRLYTEDSSANILELGSNPSTIVVAGTSTLTGNVTASNDLSVGGNLTVTGNATISGNLTFGNAATDTITIGADVASHILPSADDTFDLGATGSEWRDLYIDGTAYLDAINFNGTAITATAAELNILDGVTSTAAELNILDGVTSTAAELNILDGVTSTAAELNLVDGSSAGTIVNSKAVVYGSSGEVNATTLQIAGTSITSTAAELNILDGVTSTAAELNLLDGSTANTVVNSKAVVYGSSGELAGTLSTAAQTNITSVGTLTGLNVSTGSFTNNTASAPQITSTGSVKIDIDSDNNATDNRFLITSDGGTNDRLQIGENGDFSLFEDTGTTAKLFWDSSAESLGIGTTSPSGLLHIASTGASNIKLEDTDNGFAATELNVENGGRDFKITTPQDTIFVQGSTEAIRILSGGNVGIGTTSPENPLHVNNTSATSQILVQGDSNDASIKFNKSGQTFVAGIDATDNSFRIADHTALGTNDRLIINSSGNVGIGTSSPSMVLDVQGDTDTWIARAYNTGSDANAQGLLVRSDATSAHDALVFGAYADSAYKMVVRSTGNVGIGTSSPARLLETVATNSGADTTNLQVRNNATAASTSSSIRFVNSTSGTSTAGGAELSSIRNANDGGALTFKTAADTTATLTERMRIASDGTLSTATSGTNNLRLGSGAGASIASGGNYNVVVGDNAGAAITTGDNNVAVGYGALDAEDTGTNSVAIGYNALSTQNNDVANYNVAVGSSAGAAVTLGIRNTYIGALAGDGTTEGSNNVAVGFDALSSNVLGSKSVAVGQDALTTANPASATDMYNTAVGFQAGVQVTTGTLNTLIGGLAGDAITSGYLNDALGYSALSANQAGRNAVAIGSFALANQNPDSASSTYNTAVGYNAGGAIVTGIKNTFIGGLAGDSVTSGTGNVCVGYDAGGTTSGTDNTFIGHGAGNLITTGSDNVVIGNYDGNEGGLDIRTSNGNIVLSDGDANIRGVFDSSGHFLIGATASFTSGSVNGGGGGAVMIARDNERCLFLKRANGNGTVAEFIRGGVTNPVGSISIDTSATTYATSSDHRLKENVIDLTGATERLKQLAPKRFNFIVDDSKTVDGFLAHEVQSVVPEAITGTHNEVDDDGNPVYQGIDQSKLVPLLVATIQELEARIAALESN